MVISHLGFLDAHLDGFLDLSPSHYMITPLDIIIGVLCTCFAQKHSWLLIYKVMDLVRSLV